MNIEAMKQAREYIMPKGYGHCLCGRNEWCKYCETNPERNAVVEALDKAIADAEKKEQDMNFLLHDEFAKWYWKACESSHPYDWFRAALIAQQILETKKPEAAHSIKGE